MKNELEFRNLEQIRQLLEEGKRYEACTMLLALGNLLIQYEGVHSMQPVMLLGQYSKVSRQLLTLYHSLMETFSPDHELKQYESRLQEVIHDLQQIRDEYRMLETSNAKLIEQEKALKDEKKKLQERNAKVTELTNLKENEILSLKKQHRLLEEKLEELNAEAQAAKASLECYQSELSEDGRLIRSLPNKYGTTQGVDDLIASLKQQECQAQELHSSYEHGLTALIEQIKNSFEILRGNEISRENEMTDNG